MTQICVPIMVQSAAQAIAESAQAAEHGADLIELRVEGIYDGSAEASDVISQIVTDCQLPVIVTCRHASEGGDGIGSELSPQEVMDLYLRLASDALVPRYIDMEWARLSSISRKHLDALWASEIGVIASIHDFQSRPEDLSRRLAQAYAEPGVTVVKVAFRARSIRDNLELFEILRDAPKPTIALGMGEFGLMSRVLAPKFGGLLTFASLRDSAATAPGQPTLDELLNLYRFRSIGQATKVYGVIGWPVGHSMSPLIHNAGFDAVGHDGVYLPLPVAADADDPIGSDASFKATVGQLWDEPGLDFTGASVTVPHKERALAYGTEPISTDDLSMQCGAANTLVRSQTDESNSCQYANTDAPAIRDLLTERLGDLSGRTVGIIGSGGVARAAACACQHAGASVLLSNRTAERAEQLARQLNEQQLKEQLLEEQQGGLTPSSGGSVTIIPMGEFSHQKCDVWINCTPVGMTGGPDPEGLSIPIHDLAGKLPPDTVFFDTVYNPIETPMLKAAAEYGFKTIDGVEMFVRQAAAQFVLWTGKPAPIELFDRLVRERLGAAQG